jgi:hypothetical protein
MSSHTCSKVLPISADPAKSRKWKSWAERLCPPPQHASATRHPRPGRLSCSLDVLKAKPIPRAAPIPSQHCDGGLWQVDVIRRHGRSNARQRGDVTTRTDFCSPHRFGEAAPERVTRNG